MPKAFDLRAEVNDSNSGSLTVMLHWNVTAKPKEMSFCHRARQWKVRMLTFEHPGSVYDHQPVESSLPFLEKDTAKGKRENFFKFTEGINHSTYYLFQVHNEGYKYVYAGHISTNTVSHLFYFGKQGQKLV